MEELKRCPFCGSEPKMHDNRSGGYWVSCPNCGGTVYTERTTEEAIKAWNTRVKEL